MPSPTPGYNMYLKVGTAPSPTNKVSGLTDLTLPPATQMLDVTNADAGTTNGFTQALPGLTSMKCTAKVNYDPSDTNGQAVIRTAALPPKTLLYFIGSINGTNTVTFSGYVDSFQEQASVSAKNVASISITATGQITSA